MQFCFVTGHDLKQGKTYFCFSFYVYLVEGRNALSYDRITHKDMYVKH